MLEANGQQREVAHLLSHISPAYEAACQRPSGLASGTAPHRFITEKMERMEQIHTQLQAIMGDEAIPLAAQALKRSPDEQGQRGDAGGEG